ncbi:sodium/hydrogen exchanger 6 [Tanacetum coccineum]
MVTKPKQKPFKFSNFLVYKEGFCEIVDSRWNVHIEGYAMYRVVKRLKGLKYPFRKLLYNRGNLHDRVNKIRIELDEAQKAIDKDPSSSVLHEDHAHYLLAFKEAHLDEEIEIVSDSSNNFYDGNQVSGAFVKHYNQFHGAEGVSNPLDAHDLFIRVLDNSKADCMVRDVTDDEIKSVMFSMGDDRAPGPDGFTTTFFKKAWDMVGGDITCAIRDFFLQWPISCCNVLYKCISKIIANRVKEGLGDIVSINQSAFVPGRRIFDNILLTQELMRNYHRRRGPPRIINLCFADDLFLFSRGHPSSVSVIMDALDEFKQVSSLVHSIPKSTAYFCNVPNAIKASILNSMSFTKGVLPVREMKKGKAKVAWDSVCMPKHEGGLGIRRIEDFNIALMATHIWSIFTHRESLWVKWVHTYKLKGRSFWDVPCRGDASWGWRKLLQIRSTIRPFIWHKINNGKSTSVWFDRWTDVCPLKDLLSNRDIVRSGFSLENSVSNLISDGVWRWPLDWLSRFPFLAQLHVPVLLDDMDDVILWRDRDGVLRSFLVACVWDTIRSRADMVYWYNVVWFSYCIPRHAIHMLLVIQQKLKTQDRLLQWDVGPSIDLNLLKCPLCDLVPDSHDHLFFECSFSSQVWSKVRVLCGMDAIPPHLSDVVAFIVPLSKGKTVVSIISRIVVAATSYYIWLERNGRLFKKKTSTPGQIVDVIFSTVRLKLVTFKFKKMSTKSRLLLDQWKIPSYCIVHDGSTRQPYLDLYCSYRVAAGLRDARLIICSHLGLCLV